MKKAITTFFRKRILLVLSCIIANPFASTSQINSTGLMFDGFDDYVSIPHIAAYNLGTGDFTLEMWIRMNAYQVLGSITDASFFSYNDLSTGIGVGVNGNNQIVIAIGSDFYVFVGFALNTNQCRHLAFVRSGAAVTLYIDGVLKGTVTHATAANVGINTSTIRISGDHSGPRDYGGFMHEIRLWNIARTQASIQGTMNSMLTGSETGLIGYWKCNDGFGQIINDFSVNNNDGQLGNSPGSDLQDPVFISGCANCAVPSPATITASGPTTFCNGGSVLLSASPGNNYYYWQCGFLPDPSGNRNQAYSANLAGNYSCIIGNNCGNTISNFIPVNTISSAPAATISAGGPTTFCYPSATLTLTANTGSGISYQWNRNAVPISGATLSSYAVSSSGSYTCTESNVCGASTSSAIAATVNTAPSITLQPSNAFACPGNNATFSVTATGTALTYQWMENGVNITNGGVYSGATTAALTLTAITSGYDQRQYSCNVNGTCSPAASSSSATLTVGSPVPPTITISGPLLICPASPATFNAVTTNAGPNPIYQWRVNGLSAGTNSSAFTTSAILNGDLITCTLNDVNGCLQSTVSSNTIVASVNSGPVATISAGGPTTFCAGNTITLSAATAPGQTYQWRRNSILQTGATSPSYTTYFAGIYDCLVSNTCGSALSNSITVTVNPMPYPILSASGPVTFCLPGSVTLTTTTGPGETYQWQDNEVDIPGATSTSYVASVSGVYTCVVTNSCGTLSSTYILVNAYSAPVAGIIAVGPTTFCAPGSVLLSSNTAAGTSYQWRLNGVSIAGASSDSYVASVSGTFDCVLSNICGTAASNGILVTVSNGVPVASITAGGATTFCAPGSVTLNAASSPGFTFQWRLNGAAISGGTSVSYVVNAGGNYDCVVSNSCGNATSNSVVVTVNPAPTASVSAGGPTTFCAPGSVTLSANTGTGLTYQWKLNNSNISGATSSSYIANAGGNYSCVVTNTCGSATSNSIVVTVNVAPSASVTAGGPTTFCAPGSVTLNANTGIGLSYQWRLNSTNISGATSSSYFASAAGNYNCTVSNICGSVTSNTIAVSVTQLPSASITASGPTTFCAPGSVSMNANTGTGLTYQWKLNGSNISGATSSSYVATASGNYACVVNNICGSTTSNTISVTANTTPLTPGAIAGQTSGVCSSTKTYSITAVSGATGYTWAAPAGATITGGQGTISVSITFTNAFSGGSISVVATNICGSSGVSGVVVNGVPALPGTITGPASVCHNQNNVSYSIAAVAGATSYTWTVPAGAQVKMGQGTTSIKVRFGNSAGNITVKATNSCGTSSIRSLAVAMPCRDGEETIDEPIFNATVFPNPSTNEFTFLVDAAGNNFYSVSIVDLTGRIVESHLDIQAGTALLCGEKLADGIYIAEIISGDHRKLEKLVKRQ